MSSTEQKQTKEKAAKKKPTTTTSSRSLTAGANSPVSPRKRKKTNSQISGERKCVISWVRKLQRNSLFLKLYWYDDLIIIIILAVVVNNDTPHLRFNFDIIELYIFLAEEFLTATSTTLSYKLR